jgi:hypothetical protein
MGRSAWIYIQPQDGVESYIAGAIDKKHFPAAVTENRRYHIADKEQARLMLAGAVPSKTESTGGDRPPPVCVLHRLGSIRDRF